jgi:hypothetical protein
MTIQVEFPSVLKIGARLAGLSFLLEVGMRRGQKRGSSANVSEKVLSEVCT